MSKQIVISLKNVHKSFALNKSTSLKYKLSHLRKLDNNKIHVIKNITFNIKKGETVGLSGSNGSGKTTILKLIAGILYPDSGSIKVQGNVSSVIELGSGLHPDLTGLDNIFLYASILGMPKQLINSYLDKIIAFSELSEFINVPLKKYSSGMQSRLAFSVAVFSNSDILLLDEVFAVGDTAFREKGVKLLRNRKGHQTIFFASHNIGLMQKVCNKILILDDGKIINDQNEASITFIKQIPKNNFFVAEAKSNSMYPLIKKNDFLTIKKVEYNNIKLGDIIAFYLPQMPEIIVHRVIHTTINNNEKICITKGDDVFGLDAWKIEKNNYLGKIIKIANKNV